MNGSSISNGAKRQDLETHHINDQPDLHKKLPFGNTNNISSGDRTEIKCESVSRNSISNATTKPLKMASNGVTTLTSEENGEAFTSRTKRQIHMLRL